MRKKVGTTLCCLLFAIMLHAQTGWLPPEQFNKEIHLCDETPWKLVFSDDFDGNRLDTAKWITFVSWPSMPGGDNDHWNAARSDGHMNYIYRDENVILSEGTCKLLIRRETGNWTCRDCDKPVHYRRHTSAGALATYYSLPDGTRNSYNTGKLEARIRFPVFEGAWCAFWTWYGTSVNEIDIAEAWGGGLTGSDQRRNKYGTHAWWRDSINPYKLPSDAVMGGNKFPGQGWWSHLFGRRYHAQERWHTYTCEWDNNLIRFYIDGALLQSYWKYIKGQDYPYNGRNYRLTVGSGCNPQPGTPYYINYGFPYNTNFLSQVRLMSGVDHRVAALNAQDRQAGKDSVMQPDVLGQMEIDYVRIWQRHPELDHHTEAGNSGLSLPADNDANGFGSGRLTPYEINMVCTDDFKGRRQFQFFESTYFANYGKGPYLPEFEWDIAVAGHNKDRSATKHYKLYGQFVATPFIDDQTGKDYHITWKVKITDLQGRVVEKSGERFLNTPLYLQRDHSIAYFGASITDVDAYEHLVYSRVQQMSLSEEEANNRVYLNSRIEQIRIEELAPYLHPDVEQPVAQKTKTTLDHEVLKNAID